MLDYIDEGTVPISDFEYPIFFWIYKICNETGKPIKVFDVGGNLGTHYIKFSKLFPEISMFWTICELPMLVKIGKELLHFENLNFTSDISGVDGYDVLISSGAIQYSIY